jgi:hypothetical protein
MDDSAYKTYHDALTFGDETAIGYFDLSGPLTPEKNEGRYDEAGKAGNKQAAGGKWIKGDELKLKLALLVSLI